MFGSQAISRAEEIERLRSENAKLRKQVAKYREAIKGTVIICSVATELPRKINAIIARNHGHPVEKIHEIKKLIGEVL